VHKEIGVVVALAVVSLPAWLAMSEVWSRVDYWSHGYLVVPVALFAAERQRAALRRVPGAPDARGLLGIAAGLALLGVGQLGGWVALQGLSILALAAGGIVYLRGFAWLRLLAFPVGYLVFMIPLPEAWITPVIVRLQLVVSAAGVAILRAGGTPVLRAGNVIELPGGESLFVAEACSGITSIVTLVPIAVFLGRFTLERSGDRIALVAAVVPLAMAGNLLRVVGTVWASGRFGVEAATSGSWHDLAGISTYVLGCLALLAVGALLRRRAPDRAASA